MPKLGESSRRDQTLRAFCLVLIVVQNSSLILVTSYSRTLRPAYLPTVAVFYAECLKFAAAVLLLAAEESSLRRAVSLVAALPFEHGSTTLLFAVPALCYTLQNNLWYYALSHLDPVTAAVTSQMKVITTAVATVLMLDRRLNLPQWGALLVLTLGLVVMQLQDKTGGNGSQDRNSLSGAGAMLLATMLSAYSGVFLEKLFKSLPLTLWLQSIQLSLFALPTAWVSLPLRRNLMVGFNMVVWVAVALNALGGVAVSMALKFADNILKTFAVGISIVLNAVASALLFDVPVTARVIVGVNMVVLSTLLFNLASPGSPLADRIARACGKRTGRDPGVAPVRAIASEGTALLKVTSGEESLSDPESQTPSSIHSLAASRGSRSPRTPARAVSDPAPQLGKWRSAEESLGAGFEETGGCGVAAAGTAATAEQQTWLRRGPSPSHDSPTGGS
ncbi:hypothetical protein EMIHUDRAFT_465098 [Emiliania huxleyi CCMP1516]|uniref:Sugar phosphate transporter domain-containing protein n=2 Tax=Emiliania huxleyi TaxID=2903 RepID=A0A0D3III7_EMIH1|nr:hypothetical protein EMIHUDRAFT_465098 [Emiliania huxleyi CCMP1516]EOD11072.1 hypothetical protein EMIHUDRAFT_465098 [Emiliania huxleyi CCMP1516]|eukprot:XP_005763501.1 hypothetical protein EMIHUDRAFT_465098 [Emiliania huxleyi CCMP1516]